MGITIPDSKSTEQKAMQINADPYRYGTFAEIGAGQEVVRWFFHVGRASQTVAKSMSAYDMTVSDEIYGKTHRYVSRERLEAMLEHEYNQLIERLDRSRGATTTFFVFADTVATRSVSRRREGNGWLGVRFQHQPRAPYSEIILHVRMLDAVNVSEQEALGILGVNLIYGALFLHDSPVRLISQLAEGLRRDRGDIDMIKFAGPAFEGVDNRLMSLQLVEQGFTQAAMFSASGEVVQPAEVLYQKPVLIERGSFRPVTNVTVAMLDEALDQYRGEDDTDGQEPVVVFEMTLNNLLSGEAIDHADFLARADVLATFGNFVMISSFTRFDHLVSCLRRYTEQWIGLVAGFPTLQEIFEEKYYSDLDGGILEGLGLLFRGKTRLFVYPTRECGAGGIATAAALRVAPRLRHLYEYFRENRCVEAIEEFDARQLDIRPSEVLELIRNGDPAWETMVPHLAAELIRKNRLFGYREPQPVAQPQGVVAG